MGSFLRSRTNPRDRIGVSPVLLSVLRREGAVVLLGLAAVVDLHPRSRIKKTLVS
jgi:hypothetical protein